MSNSKGRANRLRALAVGILIAGVVAAFLVGAAFPAQVSTLPVGGAKVSTYTASAESGDGSFNWLFALLVLGPSMIAAAVVYSASELVGALRRSGRTRSAEDETLAGGTASV